MSAKAPREDDRWPLGDWAHVSSQQRVLVEDLLRALLEYEHRRQNAGDAMLGALAQIPVEQALPALMQARDCDLVQTYEGIWSLTPKGRELAVLVMRAHRLMETKLAQRSGVPASEWHGIAHKEEHLLSRADVEALAIELGHPRFDPHGDPIPTREGLLPAPEGVALLDWPLGEKGMILHVEDEPAALFRRLVGEGVFAGMRFERLPAKHASCRLQIEAREKHLEGTLAALIRVGPLPAGEAAVPPGAFRLGDLKAGCKARVVALLPGCLGQERSRLLDLGFVPGSLVEHTLENPLGGSAAYRVRGTLIALRDSQAEHILVVPASP